MPLASPPKWEDHFLGLTLDPRYRSVLGPLPSNSAGNPSVKIAQAGAQGDQSSVGGRVLLQTNTYLQTNCRLRFGEDPGSSGGYPAYPDVRNWSVRKSAVGESCVSYNSNTYLQTSVGFVGYNDPKNFCEFYYSAPSGKPGTWQICATRDNSDQGLFVDTGFTHTPGVPFVLRVQTRFNNGCPVVEAFINDECVARIDVVDKIPLDPIAWEWNLYNFPMAGGGFSNSALWVDWLYLSQDL